MKNIKRRLVIKDELENFPIGYALDTNEISFCILTGRATGFTTYGNLDAIRADIEKYEAICAKYKINKTFTAEVVDVNSIPMGKFFLQNFEVELKVKLNYKKIA